MPLAPCALFDARCASAITCALRVALLFTRAIAMLLSVMPPPLLYVCHGLLLRYAPAIGYFAIRHAAIALIASCRYVISPAPLLRHFRLFSPHDICRR